MPSAIMAAISATSRATKMSSLTFFMSELAVEFQLASDSAGSATYRISDPLTRTAMALARKMPTAFIGEASADIVGDIIAGSLTEAGVDVTSLDRVTSGQSPVIISRPNSDAGLIYEQEPPEPFNPVWPRINEGDVIIWGSYFSLAKRVHPMMLEILRYGRARKARMVYVPYFSRERVSRTTRIMPEVFDNLELADTVIAPIEIASRLFDNTDMAQVYRNNLNFYTSHFIAVGPEGGTEFRGRECTPLPEVTSLSEAISHTLEYFRKA